MALEINAAIERAIAIFEDGWASGAVQDDERLPSYIEPALREYWRDGYHAGVIDRRAAAICQLNMH